MPIYEYRCEQCGEEFEELVRSSDATVPCPACGASDVDRKLSVFAFRSVGSTRPSASSAHASCSGCTTAGHCGSCTCSH